MKGFTDNLVVTREKIEDTPKSVVISDSGVVNDRLIIVVYLSIAYLLLLLAIVVKYHIKHGLI